MKQVLITGAGTGFGREVSLRLAEQRCDVFATGEVYRQVQTLNRQVAVRGVELTEHLREDQGAIAA